MLDFFSVADLCVDVLLRGNVRPRFGQVEQIIDDYALELGGSATICAGQFANLGGKAGIIGRVGDDLLGHFVMRRLDELQIDTRHVRADPALKTGAGFALVEDDDRAILTYMGSIDAIGPEHLGEDLLDVSRHWHLASYFLLGKLRSVWPAWLKKLRQRGVTVSLDTNWSPTEDWNSVKELLPLVDWFLPNENEARAIAGGSDLLESGGILAKYGCKIVIKCGKTGAIAFQNNKISRKNASKVAVIDTIGAGDCFDAGFLRAWQLGRPIERCLDLAIRCAESSVQAPGGFAGQLREIAY